MFGDLFGNLEEQQKALKSKLREISIESDLGDTRVQVTANAAREITNIRIDPELIAANGDPEELEDLILTAVNRALELAAEREAAETKILLKDLLPPGMGGLGGLF